MCRLEQRLRQAVQGVPDEGAVTLPAHSIRRWLEGVDSEGADGAVNGSEPPVADLTVSELAERLGRAESTVRGWLSDVDGAYKLGGQWRVPRDAWRRHLDGLADDGEDGPPEVRSNRTAELSDWRDQ